MSQIAQSFFAHSPVMAAPLFALALFVVVFSLVVARVLRARADDMDRSARVALEGEETIDVQH